MSDDLDKRRDELQKIQDELRGGLSRRNFLDRLKGAGVGFGAAFALGIKNADAHSQADAGVSVKSTNPAVDDIVAEGKQAALAPDGDDQQAGHKANPDDQLTRVAYRRFFRRFYRRGYRRFFYRRFYRRGYRRFYRRGYFRFYRRF